MTSLLNNVNSLVKSTFFTLKQLKENTVLKETASKDYFSRQISNLDSQIANTTDTKKLANLNSQKEKITDQSTKNSDSIFESFYNRKTQITQNTLKALNRTEKSVEKQIDDITKKIEDLNQRKTTAKTEASKNKLDERINFLNQKLISLNTQDKAVEDLTYDFKGGIYETASLFGSPENFSIRDVVADPYKKFLQSSSEDGKGFELTAGDNTLNFVYKNDSPNVANGEFNSLDTLKDALNLASNGLVKANIRQVEGGYSLSVKANDATQEVTIRNTDIVKLASLSPQERKAIDKDLVLNSPFVDKVVGTNSNDVLKPSDLSPSNPVLPELTTIFGNGGYDAISGSEKSDYIRASSDGSNIDSGSGNDIIVGSEKKDIINSGKGNDLIYASGGDVITTGEGKDTIRLVKRTAQENNEKNIGEFGNITIKDFDITKDRLSFIKKATLAYDKTADGTLLIKSGNNSVTLEGLTLADKDAIALRISA